MTVKEAIGILKSKLAEAKGFDDDSILSSEEYLYQQLINAAAVVFSRYKEKYFKVSDFSFSTFGVKLQMVGEDMFTCVTDIEHCTVLESVTEIPESLVSRNRLMLQVFNGKRELPQYHPSNQYDEYLKEKPSWEIVNRKIRIHGTKLLSAVTVRTIPVDPVAWLDKQYCSNGLPECYDLNTIPFNLLADRKFASMTFDLALQSLGAALNEGEQNPQH